MNSFHRRRYRFRARLWKTKVGRETVKKILDLGVLDGLVVRRIGRIGTVGHGNLIGDIVGEFTVYGMLNRTRASKSVGTPLQSAGR
jgi:hypothetical protein